jgi:two-component sensor histidine kinase
MKGRGIRYTTGYSGNIIDINTAIPLGLIITELITNALKYAFPTGKTGEISVPSVAGIHAFHPGE